MGDIASLVRLTTTALLGTRRDLIILASRHRAKFEHWLKFELAIALNAHPLITSVEPEAGYGNDDRCDIACQTDEGKYFLELKTCNTRRRRANLIRLRRLGIWRVWTGNMWMNV